MFAAEFISARPAGVAPFYSLVVRDTAYTIGTLPTYDIHLPAPDVGEQHASLEVLWDPESMRGGAPHVGSSRGSSVASGEAAAICTDVVEVRDGPLLQRPAADELPVEEVSPIADSPQQNDLLLSTREGAVAERAEDSTINALVETTSMLVMSSASRRPLVDDGSLCVRLTALPSKGSSSITLDDGTVLVAGKSVILRDGATLVFGDRVKVVLRHRPLVVSFGAEHFAEDYLRDLQQMFHMLGATMCDPAHGPVVKLPESLPMPLAKLHCVIELDDSESCVVALAAGYSVVQPAYVFEWFAALAQTPGAPLSALPPPCSSIVNVRTTQHATSASYLRPESDRCPFSLYPMPATATKRRDRLGLFEGRHFYFMVEETTAKYKSVVEYCGGHVYTPADEYAALAALRSLVEAQQQAGDDGDSANADDPEAPFPDRFYVMIDNHTEAMILHDGVRLGHPALFEFLQQAVTNIGATRVPVMGDHSLFTALLGNHFHYEPVRYSVEPPITAISLPLDGLGGSALNSVRNPLHAGPAEGTSSYQTYADSATLAHPLSIPHHRCQSPRRCDGLLPRSPNRTPSRSQMRAAIRQRSVMPDGVQSPSARGRRHLAPPSSRSRVSSTGERFDVLRLRIYAFLVREELKLDEAMASCHRNRYVSMESLEHAYECKAQAGEFIIAVVDLLEEGGGGPYADSLSRFWRDCSELEGKAINIINCGEQRGTGGSARRGPSGSAPRSRSARPVFSTTSPRVVNPSEASPTAAALRDNSVTPHSRQGSSRPHTPCARSHRDMYLSIGAQKLRATVGVRRSRVPDTAGHSVANATEDVTIDVAALQRPLRLQTPTPRSRGTVPHPLNGADAYGGASTHRSGSATVMPTRDCRRTPTRQQRAARGDLPRTATDTPALKNELHPQRGRTPPKPQPKASRGDSPHAIRASSLGRSGAAAPNACDPPATCYHDPPNGDRRLRKTLNAQPPSSSQANGSSGVKNNLQRHGVRHPARGNGVGPSASKIAPRSRVNRDPSWLKNAVTANAKPCWR